MGKNIGVQENLSLSKYRKDLEKIKQTRGLSRERMKKKLEKRGYKFQKDWGKVEKRMKKKRDDGEITDKDILLEGICLKIAPMISGAAIQIRSSFELSIPDNERLAVSKNFPSTVNLTHGVMALLEPEIETLAKELKEFYKKLYSEKKTI